MIREKWLHTVADVLKELRPGDDEDSVFQREAAEAAIRELLATPAPEPQGVRSIGDEEFWTLLWGEEAYPFTTWCGEPCPITRNRFYEALERINSRLTASPATVAGAAPAARVMCTCGYGHEVLCSPTGPSKVEDCPVCTPKPDSRLTTLLTGLRGLRELSEKATAGEWKPDAYHNILSGEINVASTWYTGGRPAKENAAFIVACVNFVRDTLVRTVEGK